MGLLHLVLVTLTVGIRSELAIAIISCGRKHLDDLGPLLLSLSLAHASTPTVYLFLDAPAREALEPCLSLPASVISTRLRVVVLPIHSSLGSTVPEWDASTADTTRKQPRFSCASAKLMLAGAPALRAHRFVIVVDADTLVMEPLDELWADYRARMSQPPRGPQHLPRSPQAQRSSREPLWALVREWSSSSSPPTSAPSAPAAGARAAYYNTGVMLLHLDALRARNLTTTDAFLQGLSPEARRGRAFEDFGLGDQNLLNAWLADTGRAAGASRGRADRPAPPAHEPRQQLALPLPCRWNRRVGARCDDPLPGIRHANRLIGMPATQVRDARRLRELLLDEGAAAAALTPSRGTARPGTAASAADSVRRGASSSSSGGSAGRSTTVGSTAPPSHLFERECALGRLKPACRTPAHVSACLAIRERAWVYACEVQPWHERFRALMNGTSA